MKYEFYVGSLKMSANMTVDASVLPKSNKQLGDIHKQMEDILEHEVYIELLRLYLKTEKPEYKFTSESVIPDGTVMNLLLEDFGIGFLKWALAQAGTSIITKSIS